MSSKLKRRPPSSSCPKGAWFGQRHHTHWETGGWAIYETGVKFIGQRRTASEAKEYILSLELEQPVVIV